MHNAYKKKKKKKNDNFPRREINRYSDYQGSNYRILKHGSEITKSQIVRTIRLICLCHINTAHIIRADPGNGPCQLAEYINNNNNSSQQFAIIISLLWSLLLLTLLLLLSLLSPPRRYCFCRCLFVCLFVRLSVNNFKQNVMNEFR